MYPVGLGNFSPGIARAQEAGVKAQRQAYPDGEPGIALSMQKIAEKIGEGMHDPDVIGWARTVLHQRGLDGRNGLAAVRDQVQALLDELRASTVYTPDAVGSEVIQSAAATLCLRPGLCLRGGDCDDLVIALGSACMGIGIPVRVVKQTYAGEGQEHVLIHAQSERGVWLAADPSDKTMSVGHSHPAVKEVYMDPVNPAGNYGTGAALVTLGAPPGIRVGMGADPDVTAPSGSIAQAQTDLTAMQTTVTAGDTYLQAAEYTNAVQAYQAAGNAGATVVGPEIDLSGAPNTTQPITQQAWTTNAALAAVNSSTSTQADATLAQGYAKQMVTLYQQAIAAGQGALQSNSDPSGGPSSGVGTTTAIVLGAGAIIGIAWALYSRSKRQIQVRPTSTAIVRARPTSTALARANPFSLPGAIGGIISSGFTSGAKSNPANHAQLQRMLRFYAQHKKLGDYVWNSAVPSGMGIWTFYVRRPDGRIQRATIDNKILEAAYRLKGANESKGGQFSWPGGARGRRMHRSGRCPHCRRRASECGCKH